MTSFSTPDQRAETRARVRFGVALALAHHPLCSAYAADTHRVGSWRVCSGCLAAWPAFILGLVAAGVWLAWRPMDAWPVTAAGLALGAPHVWTLVARPPRAARTMAKALGGLGIALATVGGLLPLSWSAQLAVTLIAVPPLAAMVALRVRRILRTCDACPWHRDWAHCPGFNPAAPVAARTPFEAPLY